MVLLSGCNTSEATDDSDSSGLKDEISETVTVPLTDLNPATVTPLTKLEPAVAINIAERDRLQSTLDTLQLTEGKTISLSDSILDSECFDAGFCRYTLESGYYYELATGFDPDTTTVTVTGLEGTGLTLDVSGFNGQDKTITGTPLKSGDFTALISFDDKNHQPLTTTLSLSIAAQELESVAAINIAERDRLQDKLNTLQLTERKTISLSDSILDSECFDAGFCRYTLESGYYYELATGFDPDTTTVTVTGLEGTGLTLDVSGFNGQDKTITGTPLKSGDFTALITFDDKEHQPLSTTLSVSIAAQDQSLRATLSGNTYLYNEIVEDDHTGYVRELRCAGIYFDDDSASKVFGKSITLKCPDLAATPVSHLDKNSGVYDVDGRYEQAMELIEVDDKIVRLSWGGNVKPSSVDWTLVENTSDYLLLRESASDKLVYLYSDVADAQAASLPRLDSSRPLVTGSEIDVEYKVDILTDESGDSATQSYDVIISMDIESSCEALQSPDNDAYNGYAYIKALPQDSSHIAQYSDVITSARLYHKDIRATGIDDKTHVDVSDGYVTATKLKPNGNYNSCTLEFPLSGSSANSIDWTSPFILDMNVGEHTRYLKQYLLGNLIKSKYSTPLDTQSLNKIAKGTTFYLVGDRNGTSYYKANGNFWPTPKVYGADLMLKIKVTGDPRDEEFAGTNAYVYEWHRDNARFPKKGVEVPVRIRDNRSSNLRNIHEFNVKREGEMLYLPWSNGPFYLGSADLDENIDEGLSLIRSDANWLGSDIDIVDMKLFLNGDQAKAYYDSLK